MNFEVMDIKYNTRYWVILVCYYIFILQIKSDGYQKSMIKIINKNKPFQCKELN